jgi:hypothetical protein
MNYPLELIEWQDSQTTFPHWTHLDETDPKLPVAGRMQSVGWIIAENDEAVLVAANTGTTGDTDVGQVCAVMTIPKLAITARRALVPRKARKSPAKA